MLGDRLKIARKKAGLSLRALADAMDPPVSAQAISKYESGEMMPSSRVLLGLSQALNVSIDFLMGHEVRELAVVEFRKHSGTSARDRSRVEATVIEALENYLAVEDILGVPANTDPFAAIYRDCIANLEEAEALADQLREKWALGVDPIPSMTKLLEDKGIKVIEADLPEKVSGLTCMVRRNSGKPVVPAIVVARNLNVERRRFTLAHELAHCIIGRVASSSIRLETAMNRFAGAFLVPAKHLRNEVGPRRFNIAYQEIIYLKKLYGVSAAAILVRLGATGILSEAAISYAFRTYANRWRIEEPEPIGDDEGFGAFERPTKFEGLVYRALAEQLISPIRAAQLLGKSLAEIKKGIKGPHKQGHAR